MGRFFYLDDRLAGHIDDLRVVEAVRERIRANSTQVTVSPDNKTGDPAYAEGFTGVDGEWCGVVPAPNWRCIEFAVDAVDAGGGGETMQRKESSGWQCGCQEVAGTEMRAVGTRGLLMGEQKRKSASYRSSAVDVGCGSDPAGCGKSRVVCEMYAE